MAEMFRRLLTVEGDGVPLARIVRALSGRGPVSAQEIMRATGLARSTVSMGLSDLRRQGLVAETDIRAGAMGRPSLLHAIVPEAGLCAGILLARDGVRVCVADAAHNVLDDETVHFGRDYGPGEAVAAVAATLARLVAGHGHGIEDLLGVGLAVSSPVSPAGLVMGGSFLPTWSGLDLAAEFGPSLPCPLHAENESNCAALAEMVWGAATREDDFVLLKLDLGVGGAVVIGGQIQRGLNGAAAEFGHMIVAPQGPPCRCGNRGCLEMLVGGTQALVAARSLPDPPETIRDLVRRAREGEEGLARLVADLGETAGWGLGIIGAVLNPPLIVVTGSLAAAGDMLLGPLRTSYERHSLLGQRSLPEGARVRFVLGRFQTDDTVMGAAALVLRQHGRIR